MIHVTEDPLSQIEQDQIRDWLDSKAAELVRDVVSGQIAALWADGSNKAMEQAIGVLTAHDVPPATKDKIAAAATLQIFLAALTELKAQRTFARTVLRTT